MPRMSRCRFFSQIFLPVDIVLIEWIFLWDLRFSMSSFTASSRSTAVWLSSPSVFHLSTLILWFARTPTFPQSLIQQTLFNQPIENRANCHPADDFKRAIITNLAVNTSNNEAFWIPSQFQTCVRQEASLIKSLSPHSREFCRMSLKYSYGR